MATPIALVARALATAGQQRQLQQFRLQATRVGTTGYQHYTGDVCGSPPTAEQLGQQVPYLDVRQGSQQSALVQVQTGTHWGAEETGRFTQVPRPERICPRCQPHDSTAIEDATHMLLHCCLTHPLWEDPTHGPLIRPPPSPHSSAYHQPPRPPTSAHAAASGTAPPHPPHPHPHDPASQASHTPAQPPHTMST